MHQDQGSAAPLAVTVQWGEDGDVVSLAGEFDHPAVSQVNATITGLLARGRRRIVINLDAVTFIDAAAIGALISANELARRVGASLQVTPHAGCLRLLKLTGETDRLSFDQTGTGDAASCPTGTGPSRANATSRRTAAPLTHGPLTR